MDISVITSFNERISNNPHQQIVVNMIRFNSEIPFYLYHENSYDIRKTNKQINLENLEPVRFVDLFTCWDNFENLENEWLEKFIDGENSPFKKGEGYWNLNAKYWFRKVASWYHFSKICETRYFLWCDCDIQFQRRRDGSIGIDNNFFDFVKQYDVSYIDRPLRQSGLHTGFPGSPPETGIVCFDLQNPLVNQFIDEMFYSFLNGHVFENEERWDDTWVFGNLMNKKYLDKLNVGTFKNKHSDKTSVNESSFDIYNDYFRHFKRNIDFRMLPEERSLVKE